MVQTCPLALMSVVTVVWVDVRLWSFAKCSGSAEAINVKYSLALIFRSCVQIPPIGKSQSQHMTSLILLS